MNDEIEKPVTDGADYGADKIRVLEGLEAVRVRPAMYIGDTGQRGLHHLVYEVVDNSIDEALAGYAHNIKVTIHRDDSVTVEDDGRGIPVDMHPTEHKPAVEVVLTVLHAGGKFDHNSYKVSGGLHGVGVSCVNALSDWMDVQVFRDGKIHAISFKRGVTSSPLKLIGDTERRGTTVTFKPDATIFQETTVYEWDILSKRLRELAFLNRGIHIDFIDERIGKEQSAHYHYENGICEFVSDVLNKNKNVINEKVIYFNSESDGIAVEVAMQYNDTSDELIYSYANNIHTVEGGTHLSGFQGALTRTINAYMKKVEQEKEDQRNLIGKGKAKAKGKEESKKEVSLGPTDVREGLSAVISVKVPEPQFEGQTKTKLGNSVVKGIVERIINGQLSAYLEEHPDVAKRIVELAKLAQLAREKASEARAQVRKQGGVFGNKGKLQDCSSNDPALCELFIVEGNSAAGTAKEGRDSEFQAILPIRGKPLNVEKVMIDRVLANKEIQSLAFAIGAGFNENDTEQKFDVSKARYHRVVIMTDADVDGSHIRTLLLTFFYRHMKPLIEAGYVYIACPPLYKVSKKGAKKKDEGDYLQSDEELNKYLVDRGLEKLRVRRMDGTELDQEQIRNLILMRNRADEIATRLRRDGIVPEEYFSAIRDDGACPLAHLTVHETDGTSTTCYIYNAPEQDAMISAAEERIAASMPKLTGNETVEELRIRHDDIERHLDLVHIYVSDQMDALVRDLGTYGLKPVNIFGVGAPLFQAAVGTGEFSDVFSLENLFMMIRNSGKSESGLEVQRYKGLGEMNAAQLRETTMAPEHRKMIQVKLEDAAEAERMFVLLMGDEVERRRDYIEKYAANVKDLDI